VKKIAILPTLLTLGNGVCGFSAIAFASRIAYQGGADNFAVDQAYFAFSAYLIVLAMLFDALDGYVARLSKTASRFGGELDSLCDAISFGAAPAFLILRLGRDWGDIVPVRNTIAVIASLYLVCALLRLARFNVENSPDPASHKRFKGLPSPAAAGCIASVAMLGSQVHVYWSGLNPELVRSVVRFWAPLGGLAVALLMVSQVPYPHLTKQLLRGRRPFSYLLRIILVVFVLALARELSIILVFWGYALTFLVRYLLARNRWREPLSVVQASAEEPRGTP
jgi:CDP-diacylglycerol--serine O-phosphatidyltransferase